MTICGTSSTQAVPPHREPSQAEALARPSFVTLRASNAPRSTSTLLAHGRAKFHGPLRIHLVPQLLLGLPITFSTRSDLVRHPQPSRLPRVSAAAWHTDVRLSSHFANLHGRGRLVSSAAATLHSPPLRILGTLLTAV